MQPTAFSIAVLSSAASGAFMIALKFFLSEEVSTSETLYLFLTLAVLTFVVFFSFIRVFGWRLVRTAYEDEISNVTDVAFENGKNCQEKVINEITGISEIYPNIDACLGEICDYIESSAKVSIFVQIGRELLSGKGVFYEHLKQNSNAQEIRILHSSKNNPYLSEKRAVERGSGKIGEWHRELTSVEEVGKVLAGSFESDVMETRVHHEGYVWRIFLFDSVCFVQPYIYDSDNAGRSPVFRLEKREHSLFATFAQLFEHKWIENTPDVRFVNDLLHDAFPVAVTTLARFDALYIFVVPERYASESQIEIQAPGGKLDQDENYVAALEREMLEEIGCSIRIHDSSFTTYIHEGAHLWQWNLADQPAPYCIFKRDQGDSTRDSRVEWILLYHTDLLITSIDDLKPASETYAVVCLSAEALGRVVSSPKAPTIGDIEGLSDGSRIISKRKLSNSVRIVPRGMVPVISTIHHPSYAQ